MTEIIKDIFLETLIDTAKLIPFLFLVYLLMEYIEHKTEGKTKEIVKKSGKLGPLWGGILGVVPQCGFSAVASNLYAGRIITLGTLIAIFLSTSDEMLPILISEAAPIQVILKILLIKILIGVIFGFIIDAIASIVRKNKKEENAIEHMCHDEHCDCEHGILKSAIKHTVNIVIFIFIITLVINSLVAIIGEDKISSFLTSVPVVGVLLCALFGLIPNCASSVIITKLYLSQLISFGSMMAGLLVGSGVGILVLYKANKHVKENLGITSILFVIGVICGLVIDLIA